MTSMKEIVRDGMTKLFDVDAFDHFNDGCSSRFSSFFLLITGLLPSDVSTRGARDDLCSPSRARSLASASLTS